MTSKHTTSAPNARSVVVGEAFEAGQVVTKSPGATWYLAKADELISCHGELGIATNSGKAGLSCRVVEFGPIGNAGWTWTPGDPVFVSPATAGALTQTQPDLTQSEIIRCVGIATSATVILVAPVPALPPGVLP